MGIGFEKIKEDGMQMIEKKEKVDYGELGKNVIELYEVKGIEILKL